MAEVIKPFRREIYLLLLGDFLDISSPDGDFDKRRLERCRQLVMYAAGTGFTPMVGLILQAAQLDLNPDRLVETIVFISHTMTSLLANQHIASESEMCVNVYVISVKMHSRHNGVNLSFSFPPRVSRNCINFIAIDSNSQYSCLSHRRFQSG